MVVVLVRNLELRRIKSEMLELPTKVTNYSSTKERCYSMKVVPTILLRLVYYRKVSWKVCGSWVNRTRGWHAKRMIHRQQSRYYIHLPQWHSWALPRTRSIKNAHKNCALYSLQLHSRTIKTAPLLFLFDKVVAKIKGAIFVAPHCSLHFRSTRRAYQAIPSKGINSVQKLKGSLSHPILSLLRLFSPFAFSVPLFTVRSFLSLL